MNEHDDRDDHDDHDDHEDHDDYDDKSKVNTGTLSTFICQIHFAILDKSIFQLE